ncbi:MAG: DNA-processing protein DprA [Firmicutes bacterium]|nr:DNA-processing protein DprA [Bacillota bacterium]
MMKCNNEKYGETGKVRVIGREDSLYPEKLYNLGKSAPEKLYCLGDTSLLNRKAAAVVGARKATPYGKWAAYHIGRKLGERGVVTVSGLAYGCDAEAHRGALQAGGPTIAVLGSGVSVCYPRRNQLIYDAIIEKGGLILSEHPPETDPLPPYFAERNRIISGLSDLIVVTEAGISSGALITAEFAAEQGRTVMAVPGNMNSLNSMGCNKLIQDGAAIVTSLSDILEELGVSGTYEKENPGEELSDREKIVFDTVRQSSEISVNLIARETGMKVSEVNSITAQLEIKGFVITSMGKVFIAK